MSLIGIQDVTVSFGAPPLLDRINMQVEQGERVCLLGRNGTGKTTLMKIINSSLEPDQGTVVRQQGVTTALLSQEISDEIKGKVYDVVIGGLGKQGELLAEYHRLSTRIASVEQGEREILMRRLDQVHKALEAGQGWEIHRLADTVLTRMRLDAEDEFLLLSAGLKRRVLLARALVNQPDILLLDEPTNHLDIDAITWLEEFLIRFEGTLIFVTHDRMLVSRLATRIVQLDRGKLYNWKCDYETYLDRKQALLESEQSQWAVFDKKLAKEEDWIRQGIKARRTRDMGRVAALVKMREEHRYRRQQIGSAKMQLQEARRSGNLVIEAENIYFSYENKVLIEDFNTLIMRGDRIGIIGPNGCGKTTLLQVLLGKLNPSQGNIRLGTKLEIVYFDQLRGQLDDEKSALENVADGNDRILIEGKTRHVIGYLQEFLFTSQRARTPVKVLSGGERNRLLLAKLFARPSNLLVMDEPTNDLDIETLELLEEQLLNYKGTLLLVSHDRTFLNHVVTSTLVFEGERSIVEYVGGYDDWLAQRPSKPMELSTKGDKNPSKKQSPSTANKKKTRKLTNKEKQELETLPVRIEGLENQQEELYQKMGDPEFYRSEGERVVKINDRLKEIKKEISEAYGRWEELEEIKTRYMEKR